MPGPQTSLADYKNNAAPSSRAAVATVRCEIWLLCPQTAGCKTRVVMTTKARLTAWQNRLAERGGCWFPMRLPTGYEPARQMPQKPSKGRGPRKTLPDLVAHKILIGQHSSSADHPICCSYSHNSYRQCPSRQRFMMHRASLGHAIASITYLI